MHAFVTSPVAYWVAVRADSKEGADSDLDKYLPEADVVITTPFHPGYLSPERLSKATRLKLALTAGIGSDHVDLNAAAKNGVTVAEITGVLILPFAPARTCKVVLVTRDKCAACVILPKK